MIDTSRMLVIGRSGSNSFQYNFDEIEYFKSTKPGLTALAITGGVIATIAIIVGATFDISPNISMGRFGSIGTK